MKAVAEGVSEMASEIAPLLVKKEKSESATSSHKEKVGDGADHAQRWLLVYGASLHPKLLTALFGSARPLSSTSCIVPDAWMTFDFRGLAFLEPCYTSAIVRGVSDVSWEGESEEEYKRWVWDRCSPQLKYDGEYPPSLEGVAYNFSPQDWHQVLHRTNSSSPTGDLGLLTPAVDLVQVSCISYENGDPGKPTGDLRAWLPLARRENRLSGLQPTPEYHRLVVIGSFFNMLSQPFLAHLTYLRPYKPTLSKRIVGHLLKISLIPSFLASLALKSVGLGTMADWLEVGAWRASILIEKIFRPAVGSGYRNEEPLV